MLDTAAASKLLDFVMLGVGMPVLLFSEASFAGHRQHQNQGYLRSPLGPVSLGRRQRGVSGGNPRVECQNTYRQLTIRLLS